MMAFAKAPVFSAKLTAPRHRRSGPVRPQAVAARDVLSSRDDEDASGVLSGEWAPTWSLGLLSSRRAPERRNTVARGTATEDGADADGILSGEWAAEHEWALSSFEDVRRIYKQARERKQKH